MPDHIIADASCLILLTNVGRLDVLQKLYGEIVVTREVEAEYKLKLPGWVHITDPVNRDILLFLAKYIDKGDITSVKDFIAELAKVNYRISPALKREALKEAGETEDI